MRSSQGITIAPPLQTPHTRVTFLALREDAREHEIVVQRKIAARLATLMDCSFEEITARLDDAPRAVGYAVPNATITSIDTARALGICGEADLFGGVVPYPFVATKSITHPAFGRDAETPLGWQPAFAEQVRGVALPGYSVFSAASARAAGRDLLQGGAIRVKCSSGIGGMGQTVARNAVELDEQIAALDPAEFVCGVVIERNLARVKTLSVGRVRVGPLEVSYCGTQRLTRSGTGHEVYGGSTIVVARGGFDALAELPFDASARLAIDQARTYHVAAMTCYAGMFASRCNYDVAQGEDDAGRTYSGVLEQSWRIGGASGAEMAALEAFHADGSLASVRASTFEVHGTDPAVPAEATVYFRGIDDQLGPLTKYALIHTDGGTRTEN